MIPNGDDHALAQTSRVVCLLLTLTALIVIVGLWAFAVGVKEDASVRFGFTGLTAAQLGPASPEGYRLIDFQARVAGPSPTRSARS